MDAGNQGEEKSEFAEWMEGTPSQPTHPRAASVQNGHALPAVMLAEDIFESETRPRNKIGSVPPPPGRSPSVPPPPRARSVPPPPPSSSFSATPPSAPPSVSTSAPPISSLPLVTPGTSVPPPPRGMQATLPLPSAVPAGGQTMRLSSPPVPISKPGHVGAALPPPPARAPLGPPPAPSRHTASATPMPVVPMPSGTGYQVSDSNPPSFPPGALSVPPGDATSNPFLAAAPAAGEGAPRSLLPPPPTPPASLGRTLPPIPKFSPPPGRGTTSTAPPTALGTTMPPVGGKALSTEIALRTLQRRGKNIGIGLAAVLLLIVLVKWAGSSSSAATQEATGIRASSKQAGVKLLVDGKLIGTLPQELKGMTPGEHAIVFDGGDRYAPQRSTVTLTSGEMKDVEPVTLKVTKGSAIFEVKTAGTTLALVSADERRQLTDYSHPIDVDNTKSWTLEATKPGYKPVTLPVNFDERAERTFVVSLTEASVDVLALPAAGSFAEEAPLAASGPNEKKKKRARNADAIGGARYAQPAAAPMTALATGGGGTCTLNINTIPSSHVTLDGRNIGNTPRLGVMVSAGTHNILFSTDNARKSTVATCRAGESRTVAMRMPE